MRALEDTGVWKDALEMPTTLQSTLADVAGIEGVAELLGAEGVERIVVTGNGAAYYAAHAVWLAALDGPALDRELIAVPGGLVAKGRFRWRPGDALLAISSSGEFRDVIEALEDADPAMPRAAVTATPDSTVAGLAQARVDVAVANQRAITHTQAFCGEVLAGLAVLAKLSRDDDLARRLEEVPELCAGWLTAAEAWLAETLPEVGSPVASACIGTGPGWAAALEASLALKEIAHIPSEGVETREGATTTMTGLAPDHLVVCIPTADDRLMVEAERLCRATGATAVRVPGTESLDPRIAVLSSFSATIALALGLGLAAGLDVDSPTWVDAYYEAAR